MQIKAFKILGSQSIADLNSQIQEHLSQGWIPSGNHNITGGFGYGIYISQAMYHPGYEPE